MSLAEKYEKHSKRNTKTTATVFPRGSQKRKSNNDDNHDHDHDEHIMLRDIFSIIYIYIYIFIHLYISISLMHFLYVTAKPSVCFNTTLATLYIYIYIYTVARSSGAFYRNVARGRKELRKALRKASPRYVGVPQRVIVKCPPICAGASTLII